MGRLGFLVAVVFTLFYQGCASGLDSPALSEVVEDEGGGVSELDGTLTAISSFNFAKELDDSLNPYSGQVDGLATDSKSNLYSTGFICANSTCKTPANTRSSRIFVKKVSSSGELLWNTEITGMLDVTTPGDNNAYDLAIGDDEFIYINGSFQGSLQYTDSNGMAHTISSYVNLSSEPTGDSFVAKIQTSDGSVEWLKRYGGSGEDGGNEIEVDVYNNIVLTITSESDSVDFDGTSYNRNNTQDTATVKPLDTFVVKLSSGGAILWIKHFNGYGSERLRAIETDLEGNVLVGLEFIGELKVDSVSYNTTSALLSGGAFFRFSKDSGSITLSQPLFSTKFEAADSDDLQSHVEYNVRGIYGDTKGSIFVCGVFVNELEVGLSAATEQTLTLNSGDPLQSFLLADYLIAYNSAGKVMWADVIERPQGGSGCEIDGDFKDGLAVIGSYINNYKVKHYDAETMTSQYRTMSHISQSTEPFSYLLKYDTAQVNSIKSTNPYDLNLYEVGGEASGIAPSFEEGGTIHYHPSTGNISFGVRLLKDNQFTFGPLDSNVIHIGTALEMGAIGILHF